MASVWEANDELLGRAVAVKVLSFALAADEAARRRFTREARAAARLSTHPHVVTVYDAGEHEGQAFMVMALYSGGTVADRVKAAPVPRAQALDWLEDAACALDLAHDEGVVHRDVKPANLLLDGRNRVAVADFGIATAAWDTSMTSTGMVLGTLAYLAPEQRAGDVATPASDRYALGVVARELLTGARPGTEPTRPVALPGAAEVALHRATAADPAARPASCKALVDELEAALGESQPTAATTAMPDRPRALPVPAPVSSPGRDGPTAAYAAPVAARTPLPPRAASGPQAAGPRGRSGGPAPVPAGAPAGEGRGGKALVALALAALFLAAGIAVAASTGGENTGSRERTSSSPPERERTATRERPSSPSADATPPPRPPPPSSRPRRRRRPRSPARR